MPGGVCGSGYGRIRIQLGSGQTSRLEKKIIFQYLFSYVTFTYVFSTTSISVVNFINTYFYKGIQILKGCKAPPGHSGSLDILTDPVGSSMGRDKYESGPKRPKKADLDPQ